MDEGKMDLLAKLSRLSGLLYRYSHRRHRRHGLAGDPHRGQGRVLALLKMQPEMSQKDLAYLLDIRPQSLGELLAKLERGGYIERAPSPSDRRVMDIRLTEEGKIMAEQAPNAEDTLFKSLNDGEREQFNEYLDRVIAELEEKLVDEGVDEYREGREDRPRGHPHHPLHHRHRCHGHGPDADMERRPPHHRGCGRDRRGEEGFDPRRCDFGRARRRCAPDAADDRPDEQ